MTTRRNASYSLVAAYLRNQPAATGAEAWEHFASLAAHDLAPDVLLALDGDVLTIRPHPARTFTQLIKRSAFLRQAQNIRREMAKAAS